MLEGRRVVLQQITILTRQQQFYPVRLCITCVSLFLGALKASLTIFVQLWDLKYVCQQEGLHLQGRNSAAHKGENAYNN